MDDSESSKQSSFINRGSKRIGRSGKNPRRRSRKDGKTCKISNETSPTSPDKDGSFHTMSETFSGIEVSLSADVGIDTKILRSPQSLSRNDYGVISRNSQLSEVSKMYRAQFNVSNWAAGHKKRALPSSPSTMQTPKQTGPEFKSRKHRLPLFQAQRDTPTKTFDDILNLLRNHTVIDELSCVRNEMALVDEEISALELDRSDIAQLLADVDGGDSGTTAAPSATSPNSNGNLGWETHRQLVASASKQLSSVQRLRLQEQRGLNFTVHFRNTKAQEALMAKCGSKASAQRKSSIDDNDNAAVTMIAPHNCREGGAAATIQNLTLIKSGPDDSTATSFSLSRGNGKSYHYGNLPDRLLRRMAKANDSRRHAESLLYLSTGPRGSYYAEFRSGECWWGWAFGDDNAELEQICRKWDVYRVVFGRGVSFDDGLGGVHGRRRVVPSWIVLARDGRAAWKNIPARLHNQLSRRVASDSAPVEIALGDGDAYFVRFLDGTFGRCCVCTLPVWLRMNETQAS